MKGHTDQVYSVAYNGRRDTHRLRRPGWEDHPVERHRERIGKPIDAKSGVVWTVAYSPDGSRIVSGGADGPCISGRPIPCAAGSCDDRARGERLERRV